MEAENRPDEGAPHPRDILLRDAFTAGETLLFGGFLLFGVLSAWMGAAHSLVLGGSFIIAGCLCPFLLRVHELSHPFFVHRLYPYYTFLTSPAWITLLLFLLGLFQISLAPVEVDGHAFFRPADRSPFFPSATAPGRTWFIAVSLLAIHMTAVFAFIIPKSRSFTERLLPWLCVNASLVALFGLGSWMFQPDGRGFAFYPEAGDWCAFALLWMTVCFAMASRNIRGAGERFFVRSTGPWYLSGACLMGLSALVIEPSRPAGLLLLAFALAAAAAARQFLRRREDPHRGALAAVSLVAALAAGAAGILRLVSGTDGVAAALHAAGWRMFLDRPLFGWGVGGFPEIAPLYLSDWYPDALARHPAPGLVEMPASLGLLGLLPFAVVLAALLREHFGEEHDYAFSRHLLAGCLGVLLLLPFDNPLLSFGIVFNLLLVFFTALRWTEISRRKPDENKNKPQLVAPAHTRRVPFYTGPVKERLR